MNSGRIHGMYGMKAIDLFGNRRTGNFMDQCSKRGVFLWWSAHYREGPNGILAVVDPMHFHQRERVNQAIITQMISKGAFGLILAWIYRAGNDKVCIR